MRILLIQPRMNPRPMDTLLKTRMSPSLALYTLLRLTPAGHEVRIINENVEAVDYNWQPDLVGITMTLDVFPQATAIASYFRSMGVPVVAGGIHVTSCPESCAGHFDAICIGAAERTWGLVIQDAGAGRLQPVYHDMNGFGGDEVASPQYDAISCGSYLYYNVVTASRGCPHRCDFCYNSCENRSYVCRPVEDVVRDVEQLGTKHIFFVDDNFIGTPDHTRKLLRAISGLDITYGVAVTAGIIDHPDILDMLAATGCQTLFIGFESISEQSLSSVNKRNSVAKYERLIAEIHSRGMMVNASMVFGLDGDDPSTFGRTLEWLVRNKVETLTSHILTPYPGTALYKRMLAQGRITCHDLSKYNTAHVVFRPKNMTARQLYDGYLWMYKRFYSLSNIMRRMPEHKAQRTSYLVFNLFYRKFGRLTSAISRFVPMGVIGRLAAKVSFNHRASHGKKLLHDEVKGFGNLDV